MMRRNVYMPRGDMRDMRRGSRRGAMRGSGRRDMTMGYYGMEEDGRRGVKGTGMYGIGGSKHRGRKRDYMESETDYARTRESGRGVDRNDYGYEYEEDDERDYGYGEDYDYDYGYDYADMPKLTKRDIMEWKRELVNADGTKGEHFKMEHIMKAAKDMGIRFHEYDEKELCLTVNMLYSDYCEVLKPFISPDKELYVYVAMGKAFLEDEDAPEGSEKLALYYHCVVNAE